MGSTNATPSSMSDASLRVERSLGEGPQDAWLLHAAGASSGALIPLAKALSRAPYQILVPDFGALPSRTVPAEAYGWALKTQLDERSRPSIVFGHSIGGTVALQALLAGARPRAVFLYEPILLSLLRAWVPAEAQALTWDRAIVQTLVDAVARGEPEAGVKTFIDAWNDAPWEDLPSSARQRILATADTLAHQTHAAADVALQADILARIDVPMTVFVGSRSPVISRLMAQRATALIPSARLIALPEAGHMYPISHAQALATCILADLPP